MELRLSQFGTKLTRRSGILALMDDLGRAGSMPGRVIMMGGGSPAHIPEVERVWRTRMEEILHRPGQLERMLGDYDAPQGNVGFIDTLVTFFRDGYGFDVGPQNIGITNGSQNAFFFLFNMLAGRFDDGSRGTILLPLCPEYIGYGDQGIEDGLFVSFRPSIEYPAEHEFKYHVDFDRLRIDKEIRAICVSRPTNPTGNVLTDAEIRRLRGMAEAHEVPLIVDNAYGTPFPHIIFEEATLEWDENTILVMSLSKIGLPAVRTGIVLARAEVIEALGAVNAIVSLASTGVGQTFTRPLFADGEIARLSTRVVRPFYERKSGLAREWIAECFDPNLPYYVHRSEGSIFLWLWFRDLPITTGELYERLKRRGVIVVPGRYFFPGLAEPWRHTEECIRINYGGNEADVRDGMRIIADEVAAAYTSRR